jgi:very-short-patch-repair endonuclease
MYKQPEPSPIEESFWANAKDAIPELEREVWIGEYRVDFLIRCKKVVVELYGFEWHNTKEKLTQDAERERALQRQGYYVVRFTGSEVYRDVNKCSLA